MEPIHLGMTVSNTERTLDFYCNILGAKLLWAPDLQKGIQTDTIFGLESAEVFVTGIELHGMVIEFFQFLQPRVADASFRDDFQTGGWKHLAFKVEDIETEVARLKRKGVHFRFPVQTLPGGSKMTYFDDPDGNMLELIQPSTAL